MTKQINSAVSSSIENTNQVDLGLVGLDKAWNKARPTTTILAKLATDLTLAIQAWEARTYKPSEWQGSIENHRAGAIKFISSLLKQLESTGNLSSEQIEHAKRMIRNAKQLESWPLKIQTSIQPSITSPNKTQTDLNDQKASTTHFQLLTTNQTNQPIRKDDYSSMSTVSNQQPTTTVKPIPPPASNTATAIPVQPQSQPQQQAQSSPATQKPSVPAGAPSNGNTKPPVTAKSWLPITKSKAVTRLEDNVITIYGANGCGKSSLIASFPKAIILATEPSYKGLEVWKIPQEQQCFQFWKDFTDAVKELAITKHEFSPIVIDSLGGMIDLARPAALTPLGVKHESELEYGKGVDAINALIMPVLKYLSKLSAGLVMIGHSKETETSTTKGQSIKKKSLQLPPSLGKAVMDISDILVYMSVERVKDVKGKLVTRRVLCTSSTIYYDARSRVNRLPEKIEIPLNRGYDQLLAAWNGSLPEINDEPEELPEPINQQQSQQPQQPPAVNDDMPNF